MTIERFVVTLVRKAEARRPSVADRIVVELGDEAWRAYSLSQFHARPLMCEGHEIKRGVRGQRLGRAWVIAEVAPMVWRRPT